jgi:hypothetical protein
MLGLPHARRPRTDPPSEHRFGRRTFVGLLAAGGVAGASLANDFLRSDARAGAATAGPGAAAGSGSGADGVVVLGKAYLRVHPRESDTDFLLARLPGIDRKQPLRPQMPALVPSFTRDYRAGRVVTVQGWQLSRTEARAAAAVALGA